jgi:hypothetical protein
MEQWNSVKNPPETKVSHRDKVKTQQVVKNRGHHCGDFEVAGYLANLAVPVPLVVDLRIAHDRVGSSADPTLNGHLKYPNNLDQSLNDAAADKIRKYRVDYNNRPPSVISFIPVIASTSGRLHSETVFFHLKEFIQRNHNVTCSTSNARFSLLDSKAKLV